MICTIHQQELCLQVYNDAGEYDDVTSATEINELAWYEVVVAGKKATKAITAKVPAAAAAATPAAAAAPTPPSQYTDRMLS